MGKKKLIITIISALLVLSTIVGVIVFASKGDNTKIPETSDMQIADVVSESKTTKEDEATTEKETVIEVELEKETETTTKVAESLQFTTKTPETTKKPVTNSSGNSGGSSTTMQKPTTTVSTTQKQETTTQKPIATNTTTVSHTESVDTSVMGNIKYGDMARAGLYYDKDGNLTTYDKIKDGDYYYHYDMYTGDRHYIKKTIKNPDEPDFKCQYCGKSVLDSWDKFANCTKACAIGGCTRWTSDVNCQHCGIFVTANTCHTCNK